MQKQHRGCPRPLRGPCHRANSLEEPGAVGVIGETIVKHAHHFMDPQPAGRNDLMYNHLLVTEQTYYIKLFRSDNKTKQKNKRRRESEKE